MFKMDGVLAQMSDIKVTFTSTIRQAEETETFTHQANGQLTQQNGITRVTYQEDATTVVKLVIKADDVIIKRSQDEQNYSLLHFNSYETKACKMIAAGYQTDLTSKTKLLKFFTKNAATKELQIEYDLFSGLYLIGNYTVTLLFS